MLPPLFLPLALLNRMVDGPLPGSHEQTLVADRPEKAVQSLLKLGGRAGSGLRSFQTGLADFVDYGLSHDPVVDVFVDELSDREHKKEAAAIAGRPRTDGLGSRR